MMYSPGKKAWYSPEEVAAYFSVDADTIRKLCREGKIPGARRIGRSWRVPRSYLYDEYDTQRKELPSQNS
jgi:excisionase family DNA binding protein